MIEPKQILNEAEELMESAVMYLDDALAHIRAGKASGRILDPVRVEYYGQMSPIANVATITTPDARTIQIQPWEKKMLPEIERALIIPPLTEERRKELAKQCKGEAENATVSVRNARRDAIDTLKKQVKEGLPEDVEKDAEADAQKLHDKFVKKIDEIYAAKEKEIMTV